MLKERKSVITGIVIIASIFVFSQSQAAIVVGTAGTHQNKGRNFEVSIYQVLYFIEKIEDNILYLENKQHYDLSNVKVTRTSGSSSVSSKKRTAEMLFVNGALKEVTIR